MPGRAAAAARRVEGGLRARGGGGGGKEVVAAEESGPSRRVGDASRAAALDAPVFSDALLNAETSHPRGHLVVEICMLTITSWIRAVVKFVIAGLLGSVPLEEDYSAALDTSS